MRTIGLIGGITWHSSLDYYRLINEKMQGQLGGVSSARIIMYSVNFAEIKAWTENDRWDLIAGYITAAGLKLQAAGADCLLIGANTMHKVASQVQQALMIPLIHIAEATARAITEQHIRKVALLGTKYVMEQDFYKKVLIDHGISVLTPEKEDREFLNKAIYEEMGKGLFLPDTKDRVLQIINGLTNQYAGGVILGCTELPILIKPGDCSVPTFNTTEIHVDEAITFALANPQTVET